VKGVNADGSIEVLEANREGSDKGGKMVTHTYSAEAAKKMVFSVAPPSTGSSGGKKPKTFNEYVEKVDIPETDNNGNPIEYTTEDIDQIFSLAQRDYPTEKLETIATAIRNRSPKNLQTAIDQYGAEKQLKAKLETITAKDTISFLDNLDAKLNDANKVIQTLYKAGFFEKYTSGWL
jgi:hypothetical protein